MQDASSFVRFDVECVVSVVGSMEVEEHSPDMSHAINVCTELIDFTLVVLVDGVVDIEGWVCGILHVVHDAFESLATKCVMSLLKPIEADKHSISGCVNRESAIRIDDNREEAKSMSIVDNVLKGIFTILPDKGFTTLKVETTTTRLVEGVDGSDSLPKAQVHLSTRCQLAVLATQVTAIGENQATDEWSGLPSEFAVNNVLESIQEGLHLCTGQSGFPCDEIVASAMLFQASARLYAPQRGSQWICVKEY